MNQGSLRHVDSKLRRHVAVGINRQRTVLTPMLRFLFSLTSLVESSDIFEVSQGSVVYLRN